MSTETTLNQNTPSLLSRIITKLLPIAGLLTLFLVIEKTDWLGVATRIELNKALTGFGVEVRRLLPSLLAAFVFVYCTHLLYPLLDKIVKRALLKSEAGLKTRLLVGTIVPAVYTLIVGAIAITIMSPTLFSQLFIGISFLSAAVALALQGLAKDFVSGIIIQLSPPFQTGDQIQLVGGNVSGKILEVGYCQTKIYSQDGNIIYCPNSELTAHPIQLITNPVALDTNSTTNS